MSFDAVLGVLVTYLLHSTIFLGAVFLADGRLRLGGLGLRRTVWRVAFLGAVLTATLQSGLGLEPVAGSWALRSTPSEEPLAITVQTAAATAEPYAPPLPRSDASDAVAIAPVARETATIAAPVQQGSAWLGLWLLGAAACLVRLGAACRRFRRMLADRRDVQDEEVRQRLQAVAARGGLRFPVRLTSSDRVPVPVAFGLRRPEVCIPTRCLRDLSPEQQESLFAHELAHLLRRDPAWVLVDHAVCAVFFFQPLNWLACRRLQALSELASDSWAVATLGNPVALARCLTEVAAWRMPGTHSMVAPAMDGRRSHLGQRIERLLSGSAAEHAGGVSPWLAAIALAALMVWIAPGVSLAGRDDRREAGKVEPVPPVPAVPPVPPVPAVPAVEEDEAVAGATLTEEVRRAIEAAKAEAKRAKAEAKVAAEKQAADAQAVAKTKGQIEKLKAEKAFEKEREWRSEGATADEVHRALEQARRALEEAARQLERQRGQMEQEKHRLEEEREQLHHEMERFRDEARERGHEEATARQEREEAARAREVEENLQRIEREQRVEHERQLRRQEERHRAEQQKRAEEDRERDRARKNDEKPEPPSEKP